VTTLLEKIIFDHRRLMLSALTLITIVLTVQAARLAIDAGFEKQLPLKHPYMVSFIELR